MTLPVFGLRPILAARLRASKLPKPVICTFEPFFNSVAMMPLSSKSASTVRVASAFDILVRIANAEVSSALFTAISLKGGAETRMNTEQLWDIPQKSARLLDFLDPPRRRASVAPQPGPRVTSGPMFQQANRPGWVEVISGVMFSGKSEELIRRVRRAVIARKHVQVFKSHLDARYAGLYTVSTHDGGTVEAEPVDSSAEILRR